MNRNNLIEIGIKDLNEKINQKNAQKRELQNSSSERDKIKIEVLDEEINMFKELLNKFENDEVTILTRESLSFITDVQEMIYVLRCEGIELDDPNHAGFYYSLSK